MIIEVVFYGGTIPDARLLIVSRSRQTESELSRWVIDLKDEDAGSTCADQRSIRQLEAIVDFSDRGVLLS